MRATTSKNEQKLKRWMSLAFYNPNKKPIYLGFSAPEHRSKMGIAPLDRAQKTIFSMFFSEIMMQYDVSLPLCRPQLDFCYSQIDLPGCTHWLIDEIHHYTKSPYARKTCFLCVILIAPVIKKRKKNEIVFSIKPHLKVEVRRIYRTKTRS